MNLGKLSGLKGLMSHSSARHRFKGDLTPEMISPPLGDFRHTMHVGRGGDVFGDTSFLSNHGGTGSAGDGDSITASEKSEGFFSRTLRHVRKTPERPQGGPKALSPPPPPVSPIIKNAVSLPRLDTDSPKTNPFKMLFPSTPKPPEASIHSYGLDSSFVTLPRTSHTEQLLQGTSWSGRSPQIHRSSLTDPTAPSVSGSDSLCVSDTLSPFDFMTSFTVDMGPSLMSEVFAMIDNKVSEVESEPEALIGWTSGKAGAGQDSRTSLVDSLLREDSEGRCCLYGVEWGRGDVINSETPKRAPEEHVTEVNRYLTAADEQADYYSSGTSKHTDFSCSQRRMSYTNPDEKAEMKV